MGRLAQVLSIGVRGTLTAELPKREYFAGEFVVGHIRLTVKDTIEAEDFTLTLLGKEHLSWHVQQGKHHHHHHLQREIIRIHIPLVPQATTFQQGEFIFPFQFQLPPGLPGTFSMFKQRVDHPTRVMSSVLYKLKAEVKVKGMMTANISHDHKIAVFALPSMPPQAPQPLEDNVTRHVHFLCCFNKGTCTISGATSTNITDLVNGGVRVHGSVRNNTTREASAVYLRLYQDFTMHIPDGYTHAGLRYTDARLLHQVNIDAIPPGASKDDLVVDFSIPQVVLNLVQNTQKKGIFEDDTDLVRVQPFPQPPLHPTMDLTFVSISYHIEIFCSFPWCSDVKVEFPLGIYQPSFMPMMQAPIQPPEETLNR